MRLLILLLAVLPAVLALQANLAGLVDWHKPLLGQPLLEPSPPSIVETQAGRRILAITQKNVFGALDEAGEVVWRHQLDDTDPVVSYHVDGDSVLLLSGPSATYARLLSTATGHLLWEKRLHAIAETHLTVPVHLGTDAIILDTSIVILSDGRRITRLDKTTGAVKWSMDAPGAGSTVLFKQVHVSGNIVHVLALTNAFSKQTLTTFSISLDVPVPLGDFTQIPSIVTAPSDACITANDESGTAKVVWWEQGRIRSTLVKDDGTLGATKDLLPGKGRKYAKMLHTGSRQHGYVLGQREDGTVDIIDVTDVAKIVDTFESSANHTDRSVSSYATVKAKDGVVFNRVYWSFSMNLAACQTYIVSRTDNQVINSGYTFGFDTAAHGLILHAAPSSKVNNNQLVTILATSSTGALQLIQNDATKWTREEGLSDLAAVRFVDLGEPEVEQVGHLIEEETVVGRITRHLIELKDLPGYIIRFAARLTSSSYSSAISTKPLSTDYLHRDQFGFQKLLLAVTKGGKLYALDSANGNIVWTRNLGLFGETAQLEVIDMWVVRELGELGNPTLAVLATRDGKTVGFHIDGLTGKVSGDKTDLGLPAGKEVFEGKVESAFALPFENCGTRNKVIGIVDTSAQFHIFPYCKKVAANVSSSDFAFTTLEQTVTGPVLKGHVVTGGDSKPLPTVQTWSKAFAPGDIVSSSPATFGAISSFGRVTGDKSTLYKYLNPHLHIVASITPSLSQGRIAVIDILTGRAVYDAVVPDLIIKKGIIADMVENWLVYRWLDKSGWKLASVDLYEDREKGVTPGVSSFSGQPEVKAVAQTFVIGQEIKGLTFTTSRAGITVKDVIILNDQNQVTTVPRRLLDPRRPVGKPSKSDKEEMLIPYEPFMPLDTRRVISHNYNILGAKGVTSSPALVESTSLLLAHGLDLFLTRGLNPSGSFDILSDNFNKAQLLLTLAGLSVGIFVAKPAVTRKKLNARWY